MLTRKNILHLIEEDLEYELWIQEFIWDCEILTEKHALFEQYLLNHGKD